MNKLAVGIFAGLILGAGATWFALRHPGAAEPAKGEAVAAAGEKPKEKENPLHLNAAKRAAAGIELAKPAATTIVPEVHAFGRVLDPTPLVALLAELETAKSSLVASQRAAERAKELFNAGTNTSAQSAEVAEAAAARDRAAVTSARTRLIVGWGRNLADSDSKKIVAGLESGAALVRLDLLPGDAPAAGLKKASVGLLGGTELIEAEILGAAPIADPQLQGESFLALVVGRPLPSGAALRATLAGIGGVASALVAPRSAVVYHQGSAWVFVLGEEDTFERKLVTLGRSVGEGVVIASGLEAGDQVVTTGAAQLLSAELQAGGAPSEG